MGKQNRYPVEVRERAVRLVFETQDEYGSQWAAIHLIAEKIGCTADSVRRWIRQAENDQGLRAGLTADGSDGEVHRRSPRGPWSRVDLQGIADRSIDLL